MTSLSPEGAWIALIVGLLAVYYEWCAPGWVVPGVAGGVLAMLGTAPLNFAGIHLGHRPRYRRAVCGDHAVLAIDRAAGTPQ
jgi:hypothetical protein